MNDATAISDAPDSAPPRRIIWLAAAHLVLSIVPTTMGLVDFSKYSLAYLWAVSSIPFAQIMLLAMWVGLGQGKLVSKIGVAGVSVGYIAFWHALGTRMMGGESLLLELVLRNCIIMLPMMAAFAAVMVGMRRCLGRVQHLSDPVLLDAYARSRYSLFTALGVTTAGASFMALFRISMQRDGSPSSVAVVTHVLLVVTGYSLLLICTIWAALAPGMVRYRLMAISVLAVLLGVSLAVSAGNTPAQGGWWMLAGATLIVVVPAAIVCGSLLFLRGGGYRLVRTPAASSFRNSLAAL